MVGTWDSLSAFCWRPLWEEGRHLGVDVDDVVGLRLDVYHARHHALHGVLVLTPTYEGVVDETHLADPGRDRDERVAAEHVDGGEVFGVHEHEVLGLDLKLFH